MPDPNWWNAGPGELRGDHEHEGRRDKLGDCRRCDAPLFHHENLISHLCDACLDRDHEEARPGKS